MTESKGICSVCTNNASELIDSSKWHRMLFIVPLSKNEIEEARKLALNEFDSITQEYQRYGLNISFNAMMKERDDFVKSLETDNGYYVCKDDHKPKVYWWSYGYGFQNPVVVAVSEKAMTCENPVVHSKDASHCDCDMVPYKAVGCEDIYKFFMSDTAAVKSLDSFVQLCNDEMRKDYGDNTPGMKVGCSVNTEQLLKKVSEFFQNNPNGMITFRGISDPAECIC